MKAQIRRLTSDSAVYGISTIIGRFLNFLLVPFYTNVFAAGDYGIVTVVYSFMAFFTIAYAFGLEAAYMRFVADAPEGGKRDVFTAPFLFLCFVSVFFTAAIVLAREPLAAALLIRPEWGAIVPLAAATLAADAINVIPFAALRMEGNARRFALIRLAGIVVNIALNLYFVLGLRMSIVSVFSAGLIASCATTVLLAPTIARRIRIPARLAVLRPMLVFGLPTIPAGLAAMIVQVIDRPLMQRLTDEATVGIYGANYRLGIFMMLVVTMFQYAWQPFSLQNASQPNAERMFARVLTYFSLFACALGLVLSFYIDDAATIPILRGKTLLGRGYWTGLGIVPIVLFGYVWTGVSVILNAGLLIRKKTSSLALITGAGAIVNIAVNLLLIPPLGMYGAAIATFAAYAFMAGLSWAATRTVYPVPYEYARLLKIAAATAAVLGIWYSGIRPGFIGQPLWEAVLLLAFGAALVALRFFLPSEWKEMGALLRRFRPGVVAGG